MHVPATPLEIDPAWLNAALAVSEAFRGTRVRAVDARTIGVGYGLDGALAQIALETEGGSAATPTSLVAKLARGGRGRDEVAFYERVAPHMPIRLPDYYAGFVAETDDRAVLLLEDLSGAIQGDGIVGANRRQTEAVVKTMARFHAAFHGAEHAALADIRPWPGRASNLATRVSDRMARFLTRYAERVDARALDLVGRLAQDLPAAIDLLEAAPRTLIHSDLHADNVLFLEPDLPVVLDWPDACRGPAIVDVARFLIEGSSLDVRRQHGAALLGVYGRERASAGAPLPSPAQTAREYGAAVTWHLAHTVAWAGAANPGFETPRVREIVDTLVCNATAAALDLAPRP